MTLRNLATTLIACTCLVVLAACTGGGAGSERDDPFADGPVTDVRAQPHPGWIEVTWQHGAAATYEVFRETVDGSGFEEEGMIRVGAVAGATHVFRDVDVEVGARYRYAVAVAGGQAVPADGDAVEPSPGHELRVEFATAVPTGAEFEVASDPTGIECEIAGGAGCTAAFPSIAEVTLSARAAGVSWTWDGCDASSGGACSVAMTSDRTVTVTLELANTLTVVVEPRAAGVVTSVNDLAPNPPVSCTSECSYPYPPELVIGLAAEAADASQYRFVGWAGACASDACTVTMNGDRRVDALFALLPPDIESFAASPSSIEPGESATLAWDVSGGGDPASGELSIAIAPDVGELSTRSGSVEVTPTSDTTYTLTVSNESGTVKQSRAVSVDDDGPPPTIEFFTADDDEIDEGDDTWLRWSVRGPGDVTVTIEPGIGRVPDDGRRKVKPREDTIYRLTAANQNGSVSAEVEVEVEDDDDDDDTIGLESDRAL